MAAHPLTACIGASLMLQQGMLMGLGLALVHTDSRDTGKLMPTELSLTTMGCELIDKFFPMLFPGQATKILQRIRRNRAPFSHTGGQFSNTLFY